MFRPQIRCGAMGLDMFLVREGGGWWVAVAFGRFSYGFAHHSRKADKLILLGNREASYGVHCMCFRLKVRLQYAVVLSSSQLRNTCAFQGQPRLPRHLSRSIAPMGKLIGASPKKTGNSRRNITWNSGDDRFRPRFVFACEGGLES
jgi:hypothetical protein